jgi:hypothetical protein
MYYAFCTVIGIVVGALGALLFQKRITTMLEEIHNRLDEVLKALAGKV